MLPAKGRGVLMNKASVARLAVLAGFVLLFLLSSAGTAVAQTRQVLAGSTLSPGFDMGVNSSSGRTNWVTNAGTYLKISYPAGQSWGEVFVTVGKPKQPPRPSQDFSAFRAVSVDLKGESNNEHVLIGIKTNTQPDNGSETKKMLDLTKTWETYSIPLWEFTGTDVHDLYVVTELVFSGRQSQTVYLRSVRYTNGTSETTQSPPPVSPSPVLPKVSITYPLNEFTMAGRRGEVLSTIVRGTVGAIPAGWGLYLIVHPTMNDNMWATAVIPAGKGWWTTAHLGGADELPGNNAVFEVFTALSDKPLPSVFTTQAAPLVVPSMPVDVIVKVAPTTWQDLAPYLIPAVAAVVGAAAGASITAFFGPAIAARFPRNRRSTKHAKHG